MKSKEIIFLESNNLTDTIRPKNEAKQLLDPESIRRSIPAHDSESIYETPYSTHKNDNNGGPSKVKFWYMIIGVLMGIVIGGTATGLLLHFTNPFLNCEGDFIVDPEIETSVATSTVLETVVPTARNALFVIYRK